jgi:sugar phosphate isomerase/epimerase
MRTSKRVLGSLVFSFRISVLLMVTSATCSCHCLRPGTAGKENTFSPLLGVCTSIENHSKLRAEGYAYVEESVGRFLVPKESEEEFAEKFARFKEADFPIYACNSFLPSSLKSVGPDPRHDEILTYAETAFDRASRVGIEIIVFGSSGSRGIPDGFEREKAKEQFVQLLKRMGPVAQRFDVFVCVEPLNRGECNFINSLSEGAEIVGLVDHPNIGLVADFYHMAREGEGAEEVIKAGKYLRHCHIAEKKGRTPPGKAKDDFAGYLQALKRINYKGRISIECRWEDFTEELPMAIAYMKEQIRAVNLVRSN